jgi:hypothetical protein
MVDAANLFISGLDDAQFHFYDTAAALRCTLRESIKIRWI